MADDANTNFTGTQAPLTAVIPKTLDPVPVDVLSNGDLPWAQVLLPTTSSGTSAAGINQHGLQVGSWVFGFFADGDDCQMPVVVGVYSGGPGSGTSGGSDGSSVTSTTGEADGTYLVGGLKGNGGYSSSGAPLNARSGSGTGSAKITEVQRTANKDAVYRGLRSAGWTHEQAAGIMGNLQIESGFNPGSLVNDLGKPSGGIAQWRAGRLTGLQNYASARGKDWTDIQVQTEYITYEMQNTHNTGNTWAALKNSRTPEQAATAFMQHFEIPQDHTKGGANDLARQSAARAIALTYEKAGMPPENPAVPNDVTGGGF